MLKDKRSLGILFFICDTLMVSASGFWPNEGLAAENRATSANRSPAAILGVPSLKKLAPDFSRFDLFAIAVPSQSSELRRTYVGEVSTKLGTIRGMSREQLARSLDRNRQF